MEETLDMVLGRVIRETPMPPTRKSGVDQTEWSRWEQYKKKALPSKYVHSADLYSCLEEKLKLEFQRLWPILIPALMPEEQLKLLVKKLAWKKESESLSSKKARQELGTTLTETVRRDRGVSDNNGVVAYDTGVVADTEACHGGSKIPVMGYEQG